jgi:hypothetical protein
MRLWAAVLISIPCASAIHLAFAQQVSAWITGTSTASCGEYVQAAEAERRARPQGAKLNAVYDRGFQAFVDSTEGFLSGANYMDSADRTAGQGTETWGRMQWLENYCRAHPLDSFFTAETQLRQYLIAQSHK